MEEDTVLVQPTLEGLAEDTVQVQEDLEVLETLEVILHLKEIQEVVATQEMKKLAAVAAELMALEVRDQMVLVDLEEN